METGTFLQENVQEHIMKYFVPLKYESGRDADQFLRFSITATPTCIVLDSGGDELSRAVGYLEAEPFIGVLDEARSTGGKK
jgi:thioredoxin-related protein